MPRRRRPEPEPEQNPLPTGPAVDLLDTLRRGEWQAALDMLPADARLKCPQFKLDAAGRELLVFIKDSLFFFPDLSYEPHTRMAGPGLVIDEGFVRGNPPPTISGGQPMTSTVKVAVHHTETQVRLLEVDLDPTPIQQALGRKVNRPAAIYSEVQSLRAGMHDDFEVHTLSPLGGFEDESQDAADDDKGRRGRPGPFIRRH